MGEEVAGLFVLSLLDKGITVEEGDGFHFAEEMVEEFFGEVAKDREGGFGECGGKFNAFEVADELKSEGELCGGAWRDLESEGRELGCPRCLLFGGWGEKVRQDGLEDAALLFFVEVQADDQEAVKEVATCGGKEGDGFPCGGDLWVVFGL